MLFLQRVQRSHFCERQVLFAEKVRYLKLTVELRFSILVKCSQHLHIGCIFNYSRALALLKQYHRSLVHVEGCVFLEGRGAKVHETNDISWVVVSSAPQLIIERKQTEHSVATCSRSALSYFSHVVVFSVLLSAIHLSTVFVVTPCFLEGERLLSALNPSELETATVCLPNTFLSTCNIEPTCALINWKLSVDWMLS